jgi:hypothetical protein
MVKVRGIGRRSVEAKGTDNETINTPGLNGYSGGDLMIHF